MAEACVAITRGGVTYRVKKPSKPSREDVVHWLKIGDEYYRIAESARAENGNAGPATLRASALLTQLTRRLDLSDQDDLRAAALLAILCAGVRKHELVGLDVGDVRDADGVLSLCVRRTRKGSRARERVVALGSENAALVRDYWRREELARQVPDAPLFWTLGRHGRCRRTRITGHAVNYWLEQLRRRSGLEQRLTTRSFGRAAQAQRRTLTLAKESPAVVGAEL
ncbi:MAG TPA: tyrosine-type recombinase/integrase [Polyangiaceae bacterium]|jgi:site-specific recombinase XerD|nr:tyrosine-type recombinase/integrase [Polyangiaceae bacterium]